MMESDPRNISILVVDDEPISLRLVRSWLEPKYNIISYENPFEALQFLESSSSKVSLVISDVQMPQLSGMELLQRIRKSDSENLSKMPVLLMSGVNVSPYDANYSITKGCDDYLIKPLYKNTLCKKVDTLVENVVQKEIIHSERHISSVFKTTIDKNKETIDAMKKTIFLLDNQQGERRNLIETPLMNILMLVQKIEQDPIIANTSISQELHTLLLALASSDLYRPQLEELLQNSDVILKSQFISELLPRNVVDDDIELKLSASRSYLEKKFGASSERLDSIETSLKKWGFNLWQYSLTDFEEFTIRIFEYFDLLNLYEINRMDFIQFIHTVRSRYLSSNPYHNFQHAFNVLQCCFSLLAEYRLARYLTSLTTFALLISALCHDIEHPGFNNSYLIQNRLQLAIRYNDHSVLENHHAAMTFQLLHKFNILKNLTESDYRQFRATVIDLILATDMEHHYSFMTKFEQLLIPNSISESKLGFGSSEKPNDFPKRATRILIAQMLLKISDLSNVSLPPEIANLWFNRIAEEFFSQGDSEKATNHSPPAFMDRAISNPQKITLNFAMFVALPLFEILARFEPSTEHLLNLLHLNISILQESETGESSTSSEYSIDFEIHRDHL